MGTRHEVIPTPNPAKTRPTAKTGIVVEAVCRATPTQKIAHARMTPHRLPTAEEKREMPTSALKSDNERVPVELLYTYSGHQQGMPVRHP
jgi:hypothetical protein